MVRTSRMKVRTPCIRRLSFTPHAQMRASSKWLDSFMMHPIHKLTLTSTDAWRKLLPRLIVPRSHCQEEPDYIRQTKCLDRNPFFLLSVCLSVSDGLMLLPCNYSSICWCLRALSSTGWQC